MHPHADPMLIQVYLIRNQYAAGVVDAPEATLAFTRVMDATFAGEPAHDTAQRLRLTIQGGPQCS